MTTIAFKDGIMAAESCQTHSYIDQVLCKKIFVVGNDLIGLAGTLTDFPKFLNWYEISRKEDEKNPRSIKIEIEDIHALVWRKGKLYFYDEQCIAIPMVGTTAAIGSGSAYAMGAMLSNSSAAEAVKIACKLDPCSNPPIYTLSIADIKEGRVKPVKYSGTKRATTKKKK